MEHDHGIAKQDSRNCDPPKMSGNLRSRDQPRTSETQRNRDRERDQAYHARTLQDRHGGRPNSNPQEESRKNYSSFGRETQGRGRSRHMDQPRLESHSRDSEARREMDLRDLRDVDLRNSEREPVPDWEEERSQRNRGTMMGQGVVRQRTPYHRKPNTNVGPAPRMDFSEQETLKIKVDMSGPVRQSRYSILVVPLLVRVKSSCLFSMSTVTTP